MENQVFIHILLFLTKCPTGSPKSILRGPSNERGSIASVPLDGPVFFDATSFEFTFKGEPKGHRFLF